MVRNKPMPTRDRSMSARLLTKIAKRVIKCKFTTDAGTKKSHAFLSKVKQHRQSDHSTALMEKHNKMDGSG